MACGASVRWSKYTTYLNTKIGVIRSGIVPASRAFKCRAGGKVPVRSGFVQPAQESITHLEHVARIVVHLGSFVLRINISIVNIGIEGFFWGISKN